MRSWSYPVIPEVPGRPVPLSLYDTADQKTKLVETPDPVGMYVCGITPYDSTHLGHAATYLAFDLIHRILLDNGHEVHYVQNTTDVDDPLFERAARDGVDWRELGTSQIDLFRSDMATLQVIPPKDYIGAMEAVDEVIEMVSQLLDIGAAYVVDDPDYPDVYASTTATPQFGYESRYTQQEMEIAFAERGGDPDRSGKKNPLDAVIWRVQRPGEPGWDSPFGRGRPGWHIECAAIAANRLGAHFAIQGGGSDLAFPHHEFSAAHTEAARGVERMAGHYVHAGMIALNGTKMSKSLGNLVFVSHLTRDGHEPDAIRLGVYASHYRGDRDWSDEVLGHAEKRLKVWRTAARREAQTGDHTRAVELVQQVREALANDLDTPAALAAVDEWAEHTLEQTSDEGTQLSSAGQIVHTAMNTLLGVRLTQPGEV